MEDGALKKFLETAKELSPEERGKALENDKGVTEDHQALAQVILFVMSSYLKCVYMGFILFVYCVMGEYVF